MPANPLTLIDRAQILSGIQRGESCKEIGVAIGRCRSTIHREIARNGGRGRYCPDRAHRRAARQRQRPKPLMLVADPMLAAEVQRRLKTKDSPMRISIELKAQGTQISHETIYRAIQRPKGAGGGGLEPGLHQCLRLGRRFRKKQGGNPAKHSSLGVFSSIHDRPVEALKRTRFGHLEGDLIVGAMNRSALITVFDRAFRYVWLGAVESKSANHVMASLCRLLDRIPPEFRLTLTWDRGAEIAYHQDIATRSGIDIYIADRMAPWQRPTNENGNGLVRHHVGKGTDLSKLTDTDLRHIESRINTIPRRIFNWETAQTKYDQLVAMTD